MKLLAIVAASGILAGCASLTEAPKSFVHGEKYSATPLDVYPVTILSLNGQMHAPGMGVQITPGTIASVPAAAILVENIQERAEQHIGAQVAPGRVTIVAVPTDSKDAHQLKQRRLTLDVQPCTRYYVASARVSPTAADWKLVVTHQEEVGGCDKEKELAKAKA